MQYEVKCTDAKTTVGAGLEPGMSSLTHNRNRRSILLSHRLAPILIFSHRSLDDQLHILHSVRRARKVTADKSNVVSVKTAVCWRRVLTIAALTPDDIKMRPLRGVNIPDVLHTDLSPLAGRRVRRRTNWDDCDVAS